MTTIRKFQLVFFSVIGLCILTMILAFTLFDFIEIDTAISWTIKYFALPILLSVTPLCWFIYLKFIRQKEKKEYDSKILTNLRTFFRIITLTIAMTIIFVPTALSLIILSNAFLGDSRRITLNAKIIDYYQTENRGNASYHIKIEDGQLSRTVKLSVDKPCKVGQTFNKAMLIGHWGLLYSKK
jgi:hypothetical protein